MCNITEKLRKQFETFESSPNVKNINHIHIYIYTLSTANPIFPSLIFSFIPPNPDRKRC